MSGRPELFANKFHIDLEPDALDCIEDWHQIRTRGEMAGRAPTLNLSFYANMDYVKNHIFVPDSIEV